MTLCCSKNNEPFDGKDFNFYSTGSGSKIYKCDDVILKYYGDNPLRFRLSKGLFLALKSMNPIGFVTLYDYLYDADSIFKNRVIEGYTMKFIKSGDIKLINCNREFLILILKQMEEFITKLSEKKIVMEDMHYGNAIMNNDGMTIIDPDQFYFVSLFSKKKVYSINRAQMLYCFNSILRKEAKDMGTEIDSVIQTNTNLSFTDNVLKSFTEESFKQKILKK